MILDPFVEQAVRAGASDLHLEPGPARGADLPHDDDAQAHRVLAGPARRAAERPATARAARPPSPATTDDGRLSIDDADDDLDGILSELERK